MYWPTTLSRRSLLAACPALVGGSLAGCTMMQDERAKEGAGRGATSIIIHNETNSSQSVSVTATDSDGKTWIDVTDTVDAHTHVDPISLENSKRPGQRVSKLPEGNDYTVDVTVDGGVSQTLEWEDVTLDLAPLRLIIIDRSYIAFTLQATPVRPEK